jgi:hypothetical protein
MTVRKLIKYLTMRNINDPNKKLPESLYTKVSESEVDNKTCVDRRIDTNIAKVIYTQFKHHLE